MRRAALLLVCLVGMVYPASKAYDVVPYKDCIGTQLQGDQGITQTIVMTVDSLTEIHIWVGDRFDAAGYKVEVKDSATNTMLAQTPGGNVHPTRILGTQYYFHSPKRVNARVESLPA